MCLGSPTPHTHSVTCQGLIVSYLERKEEAYELVKKAWSFEEEIYAWMVLGPESLVTLLALAKRGPLIPMGFCLLERRAQGKGTC